MTSDLGGNEKHRTTLILAVASKMFRQHSDLFEQQAAVLERIASDPQSPSSWAIDEPSPESRQRQVVQESTAALAIKSYEGMLQIQKRVDYLERLLARNGIKRIIRKPTSEIARKRRITTHSKTAFYWFRHDHGPAIAEEYGVPNISDNVVRQKLAKLWAAMNPSQRLPYWEKAQEEIERDAATKATAKSSSKKVAIEGKATKTRMTSTVVAHAQMNEDIAGSANDQTNSLDGTKSHGSSDIGADSESIEVMGSKKSATEKGDDSSVEESSDDDEPLTKSTESDVDSDESKEDLLFVEV